MTISLHRLDATFSATCVPAGLALLGNAPSAIKSIYSTFVARYPGIPVGAFKATNANLLNEVGIGVVLLDGRLSFDFRVDQLVGRATGLRSAEEIKFALDILSLSFVAANKIYENVSFSNTNLRLSTWFNHDGGKIAVTHLLNERGRPTKLFDDGVFGSSEIVYSPRIEFTNVTKGWRLFAGIEKSALDGADLFLFRDYLFNEQGSDLETQLGFVNETTEAILNWLGVGPVL